MEEFVESPMLLLQCGIALAVPAVLTAIVNLGCGKKRDQPIRPGGKKDLSKSKPGGVGSSSKSKRSTKSAGSTKSGKKTGKASSSKDLKSKRSSKSIDKSGKSGKNSKKSSKSSKGSKSSKSKRSKRDVKLQQTGPPSSQRSDAAKQPASARTAIEAEKRSAKLAATHAGAAFNRENSIRSAATQASSSQKSQPPSCTIVDGNGNNIGTTALVAVGADSTRELKMEPAELRWSSSGGMQKISLLNQSNERQAIKVKCSDNNVYRVNPVYAIVEPGQTLNVDVMRQNGSNKVDKIVFVTTRAGQEENPKNLFKAGAHSSMMVLPLLSTTAASSYNQRTALTAGN